MKSLPIALWIVVAALLVLAVLKLPYGYYSFLRIVVCAFCAFIALKAWKEPEPAHLWAIAFLLIAVLFNPFIIVALKREVWFYLDLGTAALVLSHLYCVRLRART